MNIRVAVRDMSESAKKLMEHHMVETEEATKMYLVNPFIREVLGYDTTSPFDVIPEYTSDVGLKKGEKVDYALIKDGIPNVLIEAKKVGTQLNSVEPGIAQVFCCNRQCSVWHIYRWHQIPVLLRP